MAQPPVPWADLARSHAERLIEPLRETAREHGYALGVHGSLARDIDLIAAPWTEPLSPPRVLAEAIREKAEAVVGVAILDPREAEHAYFRDGKPGCRPHGRLCWTFHLGGGSYIDLSVMPAVPED